MASVSVNPPRTPVTKGSNGIAMATLPNVCKMPGPPPPFVPTPLPNIGKSGDSPKGYSKKVKVEGQFVAIKGASFGSMGDAASKGTGGGIVSVNTHGPTKFIGPGSFDVKIEGKNVQYLGDPMLNNCGPSGSPANAATLQGLLQKGSNVVQIWHDLKTIAKNCNDLINTQHGFAPPSKPKGHICTRLGTLKHTCCKDAINAAGNPNVVAEKPYLLSKTPSTAPPIPTTYPGEVRPDVVLFGASGALLGVIDFKFNCRSKPVMPAAQRRNYTNTFNSKPKVIHFW